MCHVGTKLHSVVNERKWQERRELHTYVCVYEHVCVRGGCDACTCDVFVYTATYARPRASPVRERSTKLCVDKADGAFRAQRLARLCSAFTKKEKKKKGKNALADRLASVIACAAL